MKLDLNDVIVFTEVVRCGSFTAAGHKLDLPPSAISRRVARLEERLGFRLLNRTTRAQGLTESGRIYYERTAQIAHDIDDALRAVHEFRATPSGLLRVTAPADDGGMIWEMFSGFVRDHPEVDLELVHSVERLDIVKEGIDLALRGGAPPDSSLLRATKLVDSRFVLVATPHYLGRHGTPSHPKELSEHSCIAMDNWVPNAIAALQGPDGPVRVDLRNRIRTNSQETARRAALDSLGIAPMVAFTCWRELRSGTLVEVLPGALPGPAPMWAIYPASRSKSAATQALIDHLVRTVPTLAQEV